MELYNENSPYIDDWFHIMKTHHILLTGFILISILTKGWSDTDRNLFLL